MVKKRVRDLEDLPEAPADNESGSDNDMDVVNVEFEFFDPDTTIDFQGLKNLLRQLFDIDSTLQDLSSLTDLILSQGDCVGNTVKVDGIETDPYAFLSIVNLQQYRDVAAVAGLTKYLLERSRGKQELAKVADILGSMGEGKEVGLVISERFINMPSEVSPELYRMLLEQIGWAVEDSRPYNFSHYLILSRAYTEVESKLDAEENPRSKKNRAIAGGNKDIQYFHPEDEIFQKFALASGGFEYVTARDEGEADSKRAFQERGIKSRGHLILIEKSKMEAAVKAAKEYLNPSS